MASETFTLTHVCAGGGHFVLTLAGAKSMTVETTLAVALEPLTEDQARTFCECLIKLGKVGRSNAQLKTLFENTVTVTV